MKRFLVLMLVAVIAGGLLVRAYLRSNRVTEQVTTQLEAVYGGPVRVGDVEIGLTGTTIRDFALYEDGLLTIGDHDEPWLKIASLNTDVSIWDFVNGNARPTRVTVTGAT